jgi:thiamine biosynthesis lipoprotein
MNGRTYGHILNPATGYPANNSLTSVTIICEDGTMADCLSTAMYVMGENKALNYWRQYGGFEMILVTDSKRVICTSGLIEKFTLVNDAYTLKFSE